MQVRVKLPSGPLIHYYEFCREIAKAVSPIDKDLEGIKCVLAKIYPSDVSDSHPAAGVPFSLNEADKRSFAKVLKKLPRLRCPMSEDDTASFMKAYVDLPGRPTWMPLLATDETIYESKSKHNQVMYHHLEKIREERKAGRLVPVDINHIPLEAVEIGAYLSRKDAIAYLDRCSLEYDDEGTVKGLGEEALTSSAVGKAKLTPSDLQAIVKRYKQLKAEGLKNYTALTAEEFKVSTRRISEIVKKAKEKELDVHSVWGNK